MSPDAEGRFRGISIPALPWLEDDESSPSEDEEITKQETAEEAIRSTPTD